MSTPGSVRMGPISLFSLLTMIILAVLAVLSFTTANAALSLTNRQAETTTILYETEIAAQDFMASVDSALLPMRGTGASAQECADTLQKALPNIIEETTAENESHHVEVNAEVVGTELEAEFLCNDYQDLRIGVQIQDSGAYQIVAWVNTTAWFHEAANPTEDSAEVPADSLTLDEANPS